jgi:hypothetical protein
MELGKYKLAMRPKKYLTREFVVYKAAPEAMDDVITEEQNTIDTMPSQAPAMDNYMPEMQGMEDPSLRQVELADGGVVQREGFSQGSEALEKYSPEMYNKFLEISKKYEGTGVRIVPNIDKGNLFIRITTEPRYKDFRGKDIKLNYRVDKLGEEGLSQIEKNADAIVSNISPEYQKQRNLQVERMQTEAKKKSKTGLYGTREETVKQVNQIVKEVAEGKRPLFDLSKLSRGELLEGSEYKKTTDFLGYDYEKSKPRFLTKKNFKIYQNKIEPYLKSIRTTVSMNKNPIATEEFKNATIDTIEDLRIKYPSATPYDIPKNVGQHMMKSIERHVDKGGKKFTKISGDNISNYIFKETSTGKKFSADIVNKNPTNKKWKNYVDVYNNVKDINYNTQFIDKTTGELTTPAEAYRKLTNTSRGVPVEFEHFDELGVFGDPIKNVGISPVAANKAANIPGITEEQLQKGFGRMNNIDLEGNRDRTVKFLQRSLIEQKMNPNFKFKKPIDILKNLNSPEKKAMSNFGTKLSSFGGALDPDIIKQAIETLPEKERNLIFGAANKLRGLSNLGLTALAELTTGTGTLGMGITALISAPILIDNLAEGYSLGQSLQDLGNVTTFETIGGMDVDRSMIEKYGGPIAAEGYDIKNTIEEITNIEDKLLQLDEEQNRYESDPQYARLVGKEELFRIQRRRKVLQDELADKQKQYQAIPDKFEKYTAFKDIEKYPELEKNIRKREDVLYEPFSLDETVMEFDDPRNKEQAEQAVKAKKLLKKIEYEKPKQSSQYLQPLKFWGGVDTYKAIPQEELINQYLAYGGRVGLEKGGDPKDKPILPINPMIGGEDPRGSLQDPGRRDVLKGMGLLGAGVAAGKLGLLKLGKSIKKAPLTNIVKPMGKTMTQFPTWFPTLINRIRKEGKQIPIYKEVEVTLTKPEYDKLSKEGVTVYDRHLGRTDWYKEKLIKEKVPRYYTDKKTDEIIGYKYEVKDLPGTIVKEMNGEEIRVYFPNAYGRNVEMTYKAPKVSVDMKGKKVKYDAEFEVNDAVPEMAGPEDVPDFFPGTVDNLDDVYGGASKIEQYATKAKQPRTTLGDEVVNRWDAGQPSMTVKELKETRKQRRRGQAEAKAVELGKPSAFNDTEFLKDFYELGDDFD